MYVKDIFPCKMLQDKCMFNDDIESLFIEITYLKKNLYLGIIYRRLNASINSFITILKNLLERRAEEGVTCVLHGDIDIHLLNASDRHTQEHVDIMASFGYYTYLSKPTRVYKQSVTLIDHIQCNNPAIVSEGGILLTDVSEHFPLFILYKKQTSDKQELTFTYRNYNNIDQDNLCQTLQSSLHSININNHTNDS